MQEDNKNKLKRTLKARHLNMIAIGGSIGTGLFVALGGSLSTAGPGGTLAAYLIIGLMVYFLMTSLGEMATFMPVSGSFETYATKFVDPALGFALGWNYWFNWAITVAAEIVAGAIVVKYWFPDVPSILWCALFLGLLFILNFFSTKIYGESEYWFAGIKVMTIIIFLVVGTLMIVGIIGGKSTGFANWGMGDAPFVGGWPAMLSIFMVAGFSFQGTELVGIAAGESEDPAKNIPKAINSIFWRIILFYIGAIIVVGFLLPYTDPNLLKTGVENVSVSPFTLIFSRAGLAAAASIINAVILTSVLSCANSGLYASARMLYALAMEGKAPKMFKKLSKSGVPRNALYATTAVGMLAFLTSPSGDGPVYMWLVNASGLTGFIVWLGIAFSHYKFRTAYIAQGRKTDDLLYKVRFYPLGPILAMFLCFAVIVGQGTAAFGKSGINWAALLSSYIGIPIFLTCYLSYKFTQKTKFIKPHEADLSTDIIEKDQ